MLCGSTLLVFHEDLSYSTYEIDQPSYSIGGVEPSRVYLNAPPLFFSHDLPGVHKNLHLIFLFRFSEEFEIKTILGSGGGGTVFKAMNKDDKWNYAVKRIHVNPKNVDQALEEARAMARFDHAGIVRYHGTWVEKPPPMWQVKFVLQYMCSTQTIIVQLDYNCNSFFIYIQMQLCYYSLATWLNNNKTSESRALSRVNLMFKQIVEGVKYIHSKKLIHRDLKPPNILFCDGDVLKICDMGIIVEQKMVNGRERSTAHNEAGTKVYYSPEQSGCMGTVSTKSDVFTLGLIFFELCTVIDYEDKVKV
ncbi:hypothetical protein PMAYCL1PPCAC_09333, partial [Pristionchus mayeri]